MLASRISSPAPFIARNLELQALFVDVQDYAASLADEAPRQHLMQALREFHGRTMARDLALLGDGLSS